MRALNLTNLVADAASSDDIVQNFTNMNRTTLQDASAAKQLPKKVSDSAGSVAKAITKVQSGGDAATLSAEVAGDITQLKEYMQKNC